MQRGQALLAVDNETRGDITMFNMEFGKTIAQILGLDAMHERQNDRVGKNGIVFSKIVTDLMDVFGDLRALEAEQVAPIGATGPLYAGDLEDLPRGGHK